MSGIDRWDAFRAWRAAATCGVAAAALALLSSGAEASCTYTLNPEGVQVEWKAFKFTSKDGVSGTFRDVKLSGAQTASTLTELARGLRIEIDGASIESGDPARNATVSEFFFQKFQPTAKITGEAVEVTGGDSQGTVKIKITMNGVERTIPFSYTIAEGGKVEAKAAFDMMDFALETPYETIHQACEEKHTGPDGISKTWTDVEVRLSGSFAEKCG